MSQECIKRSKVIPKFSIQKRLSKNEIARIQCKMKKLYKVCTPTGASLNLSSANRNIDNELTYIKLLSVENSLQLQELQTRMKEKSPLTGSKKPKDNSFQRNLEFALKTRAKSTIPASSKSKRPEETSLAIPESIKNSRPEIISFYKIYDKIDHFIVPNRKCNPDGNLYKKCKSYIDTLSEFIRNHERNESFEDLASMKFYDKRINEHCRIESIRLKQERVLRFI